MVPVILKDNLMWYIIWQKYKVAVACVGCIQCSNNVSAKILPLISINICCLCQHLEAYCGCKDIRMLITTILRM